MHTHETATDHDRAGQGVTVSWQGGHTPYSVGDPGRAVDRVVPLPDHRFPFRSDIVIDSARLIATDPSHYLDLRAASIRGLSHRYSGTTRQDEFATLVPERHRRLVACVADGLSAAPLSHIAAEIVVRTGCELVARELASVEPADLDWHRILNELADAVVEHAARELGLPADRRDVMAHLATTALFAVVDIEPDDDGTRSVRLMGIGDTSAWLLRPAEANPWSPLRVPNRNSDPFWSSATAAIPGLPAHIGEPTSARLGPAEVLVLMTDGVGDPLGNGQGEVGAFLAHEWATPPAPLTFAAQVDFARRSYDDDRTVIAVWPAAPS